MNPLSRAQHTQAIRATEASRGPLEEAAPDPGQPSGDEARLNDAIKVHLLSKAQADRQERVTAEGQYAPAKYPAGGPRPGLLARVAQWLGLR